MSIRGLIEATKENSDIFYVHEDKFIIDKRDGSLMVINQIDDLITGLSKEDVNLWREDVVTAVHGGFLEEEVLKKFEEQYLGR